jgi:hypothetical protein
VESPESVKAAKKTADLESIRATVERAKQGDAEALPALREFLDTNPEWWRQYGDMGAEVEMAWIALICGADLVMRESLTRTVAHMKSELATESSTPLESLLISQIVSTWLQTQYADAASARMQHPSFPLASFMLRRQDSATRRYLAAIRALALVRRLLPQQVRRPTADGSVGSAPQSNHFTTLRAEKRRKVEAPRAPSNGRHARALDGAATNRLDAYHDQKKLKRQRSRSAARIREV